MPRRVEHQHQFYGRNLCGDAVTAMAATAMTGRTITTLDVARETGHLDGSLTTIPELTAMLRHYGIAAVYKRPADFNWWRDLLEGGGAGVALIDHGVLSAAYPWAHYVLVTAIDATHVTIFNPLERSGPTRITHAAFIQCIDRPSKYTGGQNLPRQALELSGWNMSTTAGINLDLLNPLANPPASALAGFGGARMPYNVSRGKGYTDLDAAYALYSPYVQSLQQAGIRITFVVGHQFFGEASGYDWDRMTALDWESLSKRFVEMIGRAARQYAGRGITWQIWNEQDQGGKSAVAVPETVYGTLFNAAYQAIKAADRSAKVITGGLVSGPGNGMRYFRAANITKCDAVAIHTYGAGAGGLFNDFGTITGQLNEWAKLGLPLVITEWGLLDRHNEPIDRAAAYAKAFRRDVAGRAQEDFWFAWRDGQTDDCYGVVSYGGTVKHALREALTARTVPEPVGEVSDFYPVAGLVAKLNVRQGPSTAHPVLGVIKNGDAIRPLPESQTHGGDRWRYIELPGGLRGWAHTTAAGQLRVEL